jgi:uncharacterized protein
MSEGRRREVPSIFGIGLIFEAGLGAVALLLGLVLGVDPLHGITFGPVSIGIGVGAALPLLALVSLIRRSRWPMLRNLVESARELVRRFFSHLTLPRTLALAAAAGFGEELLFRGLLQSFVAARIGLAGALIVTSVVFGLLHFVTKGYALYAFFISLYLGLLYAATGNILVPMLTHAVYDAVVLRALDRSPAWSDDR